MIEFPWSGRTGRRAGGVKLRDFLIGEDAAWMECSGSEPAAVCAQLPPGVNVMFKQI